MGEDVILKRQCQVEPLGGGAFRPLTISFFRPVWDEVEEDEVKIRFTIACDFFNIDKRLPASDELQALVFALDIALVELQLKVREGHEIYFDKKGDLEAYDFWKCRATAPTYIPSSFGATRWGAPDIPPTRILTPSHRVAVDEADGLAIAIFKVGSDGLDEPFKTIPADRIADLGADETARTLGQVLLMDTPGGRELFGCERDLPVRMKPSA